VDRWWQVISGRRNEWVDIWVGARALAWNLGVGAPRRDGQPGEAIDWAARAASRAGRPRPRPTCSREAVRTGAAGRRPGAPPETPSARRPQRPARRFFRPGASRMALSADDAARLASLKAARDQLIAGAKPNGPVGRPPEGDGRRATPTRLEAEIDQLEAADLRADGRIRRRGSLRFTVR
jgi:hypothetical protein